ncbi:hypothetical protein B7463_g3843, partial [Scytalidium lignicola]
MADHKLYHRKLKTNFQGIHHPHSIETAPVTQFRGIKFASIPARWQQSKLEENYSESYDATKYGPACPQFIAPLAHEDFFNGIDPNSVDAIKTEEPYEIDEFECLNLNISCPTSNKLGTNLPVMVCIHGGGLLGGRNSSWFVDGGAFVSKSVEAGKPVIFVTLNYRLGSLGFLASKELLEDNREAGDEGVGNYGPHDIHLGIEWVYRNISHFGGDQDNITLLGESAGALSTLIQIYSKLPRRFRRAVIQSGQIDSCTMSYPATLEEQQSFYEGHKKVLGVTSLEEMRKLPVSAYDFVAVQLQQLGMMICRVTIDNKYYDASWRDFDANGLEIIVGDNANEFTVFEGVIRSIHMGQGNPRISIAEFISTLKSVISEETIMALFEAYDIRPGRNVKDTLARLWEIVEDSTFTEPTERFASAATAKGATVYRYLFDEINPFGGPFFGKFANHLLELPYLYGPDFIFDNVKNPTKERDLAVYMQQKWNQFVYGEKIWTPFDKGGYYVFGPEGEVGEVGYEEFKKRRRTDRWLLINSLPFVERWELIPCIVSYASTFVWDTV